MKLKLIHVETSMEDYRDRVLSPDLLRADPALVALGWERRFTADEQRATEAIELYEKLGYEVCAEPLRSEEFGHGCEECCSTVAFRFLAIYTRKKSD
jgi:hypothetical protein